MQSDWGPFQDQHLFSQEQLSQSLLKPFGIQQCVWWQVKFFDVAIRCTLFDVHCTTRELPYTCTTELLSQSDKQLTSHLMDNSVNIVIDGKINSYQVNHSNAVSCQSDQQLLSRSANGWIVKVAEHSFYLIEMRYPSLLVMLTSLS